MTRFCYVCKQHVVVRELPNGGNTFALHGHSAEKVRELKRNLGRKQR